MGAARESPAAHGRTVRRTALAMSEQAPVSLRPVIITTAVASCFAAAYGFMTPWNPTLEPSALVALFLSVGPLISVVIWVQNDAQARRIATVQDWGLFVYLLFPVMVPRHVFLTRGRGAWRLALALVAAVFAPIAGAVIGLVVGATVHVLGRQ